jgi:serine protease Do
MSLATNQLVVISRRYLAPVALSAVMATGAVALVNHNTGVHAAANISSPLDDNSVSALAALDQDMERLTARVAPAVVNIAVTSTPQAEDSQAGGTSDDGQQGMQGLPPELQRFFGMGGGGQMMPPRQQLQHGIGSGVIISPDGYIVTNNHVVAGAKDIKVTLHDRRVLNGKVVGTDKMTDIAVVKVDARDLPAMSWGDSSHLAAGQTVLAFGSPFGYFQDSVTRGIVSAVNRSNPYETDARKPGGYIQTDAAINPGNSGGALVNAHGELIGINNWIATDNGSFAGAGFAIPAQIAKSAASQLIAHGKVEHGYLGISMNDVTPANAHFFNLKDAQGAIVADVTPDSPASRAGLKQGDVITGLNGQPISNGSALQVDVAGVAPGSTISLNVIRDGQPQTVRLRVGTYDAKGTQVAANDGSGGHANTGKLGLGVGDVTSDVRQQLNLPDNVKGAVVQQVRPASPAEDAGLQPGDVILQVNRQPTPNANQFVSTVHGAAGNNDMLLLVWSHGNASYRTLRPSDAGNNGE